VSWNGSRTSAQELIGALSQEINNTKIRISKKKQLDIECALCLIVDYGGANMSYSIMETGKKLGLSIHTLRYYEKAGLMPEIMRNETGGRVYTDSDISWIYLIRCLRDIDMPIQNIRDYINLLKNPNSTLEERCSMVEAFKKEIGEKLRKYKIVQSLIDKKLEFYHLAEQTGKTEADVCYNYHSDWEHFMSVLEDNINE